MKFIIYLLSLIFVALSIEYNELNQSNILKKNEIGQRASYEACLRLKKNSNFNLKCESLLDKNEKEQKNDNIINANIKTLSFGESETRQVNKLEEMKLRKFMNKLSKGVN